MQRSTARLELWKSAASLRSTKVTMETVATIARPLSSPGGLTFCPCSPSDKYAVRFIPRENGLYLIDVKFNGSHIPGSPFKIRVGETGQAGDPGMVSAYGAGLEGGSTGEREVRGSDQPCPTLPLTLPPDFREFL